jgi:hypothetical protein
MRHAACFLILLSALSGCNGGFPIPATGNAPAPDARTAASSSAPVVSGCQIFPTPPSSGPTGNDWWNTDISKYPVDPKSSTYIAHLPGNLHPDFGHEPYYGIPFNVVPSTQKKVPVRFFAYPTSSVPGPYPIPPNAQVEGQPRYNTGDRHLLVMQQGTCKLYEMWEATQKSGGRYWVAANGAVFDLSSNKLWPKNWTSADAAGLPIFPALIKCDEVAAGSIDHALRVTFQSTYGGFITPARHHTNGSDPNYPPMGARFRLKASFNISHFNRTSQIILTAMQKYGMLVADNGSNWYFQGQGGREAACWNDNELDQLKSVSGKNFEVVKTGPIQK